MPICARRGPLRELRLGCRRRRHGERPRTSRSSHPQSNLQTLIKAQPLHRGGWETTAGWHLDADAAGASESSPAETHPAAAGETEAHGDVSPGSGGTLAGGGRLGLWLGAAQTGSSSGPQQRPHGSAQWWEPALLSSERGALPAMVTPSCCQPWRGSRTNFRSPAWVGAQAGAALLPPEHPIPSQSVAPVPSTAISPPYQGPSPQAGWEQRLQAERPPQQKWESGLREGCRTARPSTPPFSRTRGLLRPPAALSQGVQSTQNA